MAVQRQTGSQSLGNKVKANLAQRQAAHQVLSSGSKLEAPAEKNPGSASTGKWLPWKGLAVKTAKFEKNMPIIRPSANKSINPAA